MIQSGPCQVRNIKRKDKQIQLNSNQKEQIANSWQPFPKQVATLLSKLTEYIFNLHFIKKNVSETLQNILQKAQQWKCRLGTVSNKLLG